MNDRICIRNLELNLEENNDFKYLKSYLKKKFRVAEALNFQDEDNNYIDKMIPGQVYAKNYEECENHWEFRMKEGSTINVKGMIYDLVEECPIPGIFEIFQFYKNSNENIVPEYEVNVPNINKIFNERGCRLEIQIEGIKSVSLFPNILPRDLVGTIDRSRLQKFTRNFYVITEVITAEEVKIRTEKGFKVFRNQCLGFNSAKIKVDQKGKFNIEDKSRKN